MRRNIVLIITVLALLGLLIACAAPTPTAAPTKPAAPVAATTAPSATKPAAAPAAAATTAPVATKPAAAAPTAAPVAKVKRGGTLRGAQQGSYMSLDPHIATTRSHWGLGSIYDCLVELVLADPKERKWEIKPYLAESFKQVDPTTVEFKIRPGVKFHDGSDLTAEDVRFSLDRVANHPKSYGKDFVTAQASVERVDNQTVRVKLKSPNAAYIGNITCWAFTNCIVSKAALEKLGDEEFGRKPVGTGPFSIAEYMPDDRVTVKKFANYWGKGEDGQPLPYLDGAIYRVINDAAVLQVELKAAGIDIVGNVDAKDVAGVKSNTALVLDESPGQAQYYFTYGLNTATGPFANNLKLRQAAHYALDRENMAKVFTFGAGTPAYYPFWTAGMLGYDEKLPRYEFNPEKAKQLVREAGFPNGVDITMLAIARDPERRIGEVAKQMWDTVGIRTKLDVLERLAFNSRMNGNNFEVGFWRSGTRLDPDLQKFYVYTKASANWSNWYNKDMDKCMDEGGAELDSSKRAEIYKRCQKIIYDEAFVNVGYLLPDSIAYQKYVKGITWQFATNSLHRVWLDK
jgi:peptide/nickel transport system substrate-binding protein